MQNRLPKALPEFNTASILVIGDVMLDRYWFGDTKRISPEAPVPIVKIGNVDNRPGGAGNVALNISALGARVTLLGVVGNDEAANLLEQQLTAASITHDLHRLNQVTTIIKLRVLSRHQQLLRMDFEETLQSADQTTLLASFEKHLAHAHLVILSDYKKGTLANPQAFIKLAKAANIPVLVDPKGTDFSIYRDAHIITPNYKEFEAVVGHCQNEQAILEKGRALLAQFNINTLLITRGEDGMTLIENDASTHLPAYAREVFDVTGAGDTVIAALGSAFAAQVPIVEATAIANLAASLSVAKLGAAVVTADELQIALSGKTAFSQGIVNEEQLLQAVNIVRSQGKKIVFTNGCFDLLHAGHVTYLQLAKQLGDYLVVAVNTDESIQTLKGPKRPITNLQERLTVLAAVGAIDWVIPFADKTPERLLRLVQPDILVKGGDYSLSQVVGADIVRSYGGEVRTINHGITTSSTSIIQKLELAIDGALA